MTDYRQRFRERFSHSKACELAQGEYVHYKKCICEIADILAFIVEEKARSYMDGEKNGYSLGCDKGHEIGRAEALAALIEKVKEIPRRNGSHSIGCVNATTGESGSHEVECNHYNIALDDLLTHLRGEEKPCRVVCPAHPGPCTCDIGVATTSIEPPIFPRPQSGVQEETSCRCGDCAQKKSIGTTQLQEETECCEVGESAERVFNLLMEKLYYKPRTEVTKKHVCGTTCGCGTSSRTEEAGCICGDCSQKKAIGKTQLGMQTEKEGASFSVRDEEFEMPKLSESHAPFCVMDRDHRGECSRTTPQSREQCGEKMVEVYEHYSFGEPCREPECPCRNQTNQ